MNEKVLTSLLTQAMNGLEEARLGYLAAAKALHDARYTCNAPIDPMLHRDVLLAMDAARDFTARLTEHVDVDSDHHGLLD